MTGSVILFLLIAGIVAVMIVKNNEGKGELQDITELVVWSVIGIVLLMAVVLGIVALL